MFGRARKYREIQCPIVITDPHLTIPENDAASTMRTVPPNEVEAPQAIFDMARKIFSRSGQKGPRRAAGIL